MPCVVVEIPQALSRYSETLETVELTGETVGEVLAALWNRFPHLRSRMIDGRGNPYPYLPLFLNGRKLTAGFNHTPVSAGDRLEIIALAEGG